MKVMSISRELDGQRAGDLWKPGRHYTRTRKLPCELVECYSAEDVYKHGDSADVIVLGSPASAWPLFWNDIAGYVEGLPAFVAIFSIDSWRTIWRPGRAKIQFNAIIPFCWELYLVHRSQHNYDCKHAFYSPCCVDVPQVDIEKDIDVIVWGNNRLPWYPFRNFIVCKLFRFTLWEGVRGGLIKNKLGFGEKRFDYVRVPFNNNRYYGQDLYPLLSRARICCTGSARLGVPGGKYFENAACGCVSLSNDFTDRELLGFEHGKHLWITDKKHFVRDLTFLLENPSLVAGMAANARQLVAERHTVDIRASELYEFLRQHTGIS